MALNEKDLTKGQLRQLKALRNSVGNEIGTRAFEDWMASNQEPDDKTAEWISGALQPLVTNKKLKMPKSGYHISRGRGRIIVTPYED